MLAARILRRRSTEPAASGSDYAYYTKVYRQAKSLYLAITNMQDKLWEVKRMRIDEPDKQCLLAYIDDALENVPTAADPDSRGT